MIIVFSLLIAIIGLLMYALCSNGKLQEIGRIMFFCGLLAWLLAFLLGGGVGTLIHAIPSAQVR